MPTLSGGRRAPRKKVNQPAIAANATHQVRSKLEKYCVEYFDAKGIAYNYEPLLLLVGRQYRPDFYLPEFDLFVEICGFTHMPYYLDRVEEKRRQYAERGLRAVFLIARKKSELLKQLTQLTANLSPSKRD